MQQQQRFFDDDDGSIDLKSAGFLFSKQLNLDQVPDAVECSFTSSFDDSESLCVLDDGDDHQEKESQQEDASGYLHAFGETIKSALETISNRQGYRFKLFQSLEQKAEDSNDRAVHHRKRSIVTKSVRFAVNDDNEIQCTTRRYPREDALHADLWISEDQLEQTQSECEMVADFYKTNHPKYVAAVLGLSFSYEPNVVKTDMNKFRDQVRDNGCARGLETYIVELTQTFREAHIHMVLAEQNKQRQNGTEFHKKGIESIRKVAKKTSRPSRQLARKLAENDTFEAVKATLTPW